MGKKKKNNGIRLRERVKKGKKGLKKLNEKRFGFFGEFKKFILRGNVIDLAVGVIIGGAFQKIVSSLVADLAMPLIGAVTDNVNFDNMYIPIRIPEDVVWVNGMTLADAVANGITTLNYGSFVTTVIDFIIMAFVIFVMVKIINTLSEINKKPVEEAEATEKKCPYCESDVPVSAVKCKYCTSDLEVEIEETENESK